MKEIKNMRNSQYTKEFRDETVELVFNSEKPAIQIAKDLGINEKTLYNWIRVYKKEHHIAVTVNEAKSSKSSSQEEMALELKKLRAENKLLKQERDILKKATAYFAKETL